MFVRLSFCKFIPGKTREAKKIFQEEIVPAIRKQKGNIQVRLLEPTDKSEDFIAYSEWKTRADAEAYVSSGAYKKMVGKLEAYFTKFPELKTYLADEVLVKTDHL
jgi:quinol monooxygenase YgiN